MLRVNQLIGFGAGGGRPGPYTISYAGTNLFSGVKRTISFDIGPYYSDRIVFIRGVSGLSQGITSCSVNGAACTKIGGATSYSVRKFWRVVAPP